MSSTDAAPAVTPSRLPAYHELPVTAGAPEGSAWGVYGADDELGTLNNATPERMVAAARLVRTGRSFGLQLPLGWPDPPIAWRRNPEHHVLRVGFQNRFYKPGGVDVADGHFEARDDYLSELWLQGSSQWDSLAHVRHPVHGNYNGVADDQIGPPHCRLGVDRWARRGIVARGVLLDVARHHARHAEPFDPFVATTIPVEVLEATAREQGVEILPGDVLIIHTGWTKRHMDAPREVRERQLWECAGLEPSEAMAAFLWDCHIAAIASDNCAIEALRLAEPGLPLHKILLCLFGMPLGEFWYLHDLAEDCAADGVYEFQLVSVPLHVPGGVGSPSQAVAIK